MKIFNLKINIKKMSYVSLIAIIILLVILLIFLFNENTTIHMNNKNYTQILLDSHTNISKFIGKKIVTTGYIFRANDFQTNNFVVARDMIIDNSNSNIVGFLCDYSNASDFENNVWVEVHGQIILGNYYGPIPIIKINTIKKITTPEDTFVYPPNK